MRTSGVATAPTSAPSQPDPLTESAAIAAGAGVAGSVGKVVGAAAADSLPLKTGPLVTLHFPFDVATIQPEHTKALNDFATNVWPTLKGKELLVVGNTDDVGTKSHNDKLAQRRAESVAEALRALGIASVHTRAAGKCCYIADNGTEKGRAANRRTDISLFTTPKQEQEYKQ